MKLLTLLTLSIWILPLAALADDAADLALARKYNAAMDRADWEGARLLMSPDIVFEDPTWGNDPVVGPDSVTKAYSGSDPEANLIMEERFAFATNGVVVFHYFASADMKAPPESSLTQRVHVQGDVVKVIRVENGKIRSHTDLADYGRIMTAVAELEKKLAKASGQE